MKSLFGFLNLIKPPGMTSHDMVDEVRKIFKIRKVGHGGTLDPGAAGTLPIAVGKATKLFEYFGDAEKVYRGEITFGITTTTQDAQGALIEKKDATSLMKEKIERALEKFVGKIDQIPPQVSAVRHQGKHSYEWERKGVVVPLPPRPVEIKKISLLQFTPGDHPKILVDVWSSPGMYMRALARDLGEAVGTGAFLSFLVRLESAPFRIEEGYTLEEVREKAALGEGEAILVGSAKALPHIPKIQISEQQKFLLLKDGRLPIDAPGNEALVQLHDEEEELIALGRVEGNKKPYFFQPVKIF